jgi:hypothetical protein
MIYRFLSLQKTFFLNDDEIKNRSKIVKIFERVVI